LNARGSSGKRKFAGQLIEQTIKAQHSPARFDLNANPQPVLLSECSSEVSPERHMNETMLVHLSENN